MKTKIAMQPVYLGSVGDLRELAKHYDCEFVCPSSARIWMDVVISMVASFNAFKEDGDSNLLMKNTSVYSETLDDYLDFMTEHVCPVLDSVSDLICNDSIICVSDDDGDDVKLNLSVGSNLPVIAALVYGLDSIQLATAAAFLGNVAEINDVDGFDEVLEEICEDFSVDESDAKFEKPDDSSRVGHIKVGEGINLKDDLGDYFDDFKDALACVITDEGCPFLGAMDLDGIDVLECDFGAMCDCPNCIDSDLKICGLVG